MKKIYFSMLLLLLAFNAVSQTQFWSDTFEDSGAPSSGSRTPSIELGTGGPPFTAYFLRTNGSNINLNAPVDAGSPTTYLNFQGSKFWAGEDLDNAGLGGVKIQTITWSSINITGKSGLSMKGLFAASNDRDWQNFNFGPTYDFLEIEYRIDGGAWTLAGGIYPDASNGIYGRLRKDTNGDKIGDGAVLLSRSFQEFDWNISGTGAALDLRFKVSADAGAVQEFAVDNFRLFETATCTPPTITGNPPNRTICVGSNTTFTASATGATAYQWQVNTGSGFTNIVNGAPYSGATTTTLTVTGATAGMSGYTYRMVAINGVATCFTNTNTSTLTVSNITASTAQINVSCFGGTNGAASVSPSGGIAPYSYSWSPMGATASTVTGLAAGTYTVTITDNIGCQATRSFTINQPASAVSGTATITNVACNGGNTGAINLTPSGGTGPYTFNWGVGNPTTEDRTGLTAGNYSVTITDANGCTAVRNFTVTQPTAISGSTVVTNVACNGGNTGAIDLTPTGGVAPYTYSWSGGPTAQDRTGLAAGTYSVTIFDANGCSGTVSGITVTQPASAVSGTATITNVACNGGNTGAINLTPSGGTGPYTFNWGVGNPTTEDRTSLTAGNYSVTITDANGCTAVRNFTVTQPTAISGSTVVTNVACNGGNTGAIDLTPTGGVAPYTYSWSGGPTAQDRTGLAAGTYSVTIFDANGCSGTVSGITVTQPASAVSGTATITNVACNGGNTGAINLTPSGGTGPYTFNWGVGNPTTEDRTGLTAGNYSVTITDANGCTAVRNFTVTQPSLLSTSYTGSSTISKDVAFSYSFSSTGGTPGYTYNHTGILPNGLTLSGAGLLAGTPSTAGTFNFNVIVTDANSCQANVSVSITVQGVLPVELDAFRAKPVASGVEISWKTLSERNSSHFELLHAGEGGKFRSIAKIDALGNSFTGKNYSFLHRQAVNGANYYQLLQIDQNGDIKDYGVKIADFAVAAQEGVILYPNPTSHTVTVKFAAKTYTQVRVADMLGKVVIAKQLGTSQTEQVIHVEKLPSGTYTLILTDGVNSSVHKLIKR